MSHIVGTIQTVGPAIVIGPDTGAPATAPNVWEHKFQHTPAPGGTKLLLLHFSGPVLPASNRVEVDLGYGGADSMDVFTSANGPDFWTRPINVAAFADGKVPIRYVTNGAPNGKVSLDKYGRGERHAGDQDPTAFSNCDPFLLDPVYVEPEYDPFWYCTEPPNWENIAKVTAASDLRRTVAASVGMVLHVDHMHNAPFSEVLSTCSVTLVGPDLVLTAGHCMADPAEHAKSSSVIFNYALDENGARPAGYAGRFFKVSEVVAQHWNQATDKMDYCLFRLAVAPGLPSIQMRPSIPGANEQVFGVHHPNGAVKKLSLPHQQGFAAVLNSDADNIRVPSQFHVSGGSSGSGLFDAAGRVTGVLADGDPCGKFFSSKPPLRYYPTASILQQIAQPPVQPPATRDVMVVMDRSGSMSAAGSSGRPKLAEARDAAALFVQLIRAGAGNRIGLVSFSTSEITDFTLHNATGPNKTTLVGPPPFVGGKIGALAANGSTAIGKGLIAAAAELPASAANPRTILLLTDGLQNVGPMIGQSSVQNAIAGIDINAIGYGTASNLDGPLLSALAAAHNGSYARADTNLQLEKYFAQAFGNIFESGLLADPEFDMADEERRAKPIPFRVCGEETITIVTGWANLATALLIEVTAPNGALIHAGAAGTTSVTGTGWTFLRIPLPHGGERDGLWHVTIFRPGGGEFPPPAPATRYFVNIIANGGPKLRRVPDSRIYYTGDPINPMVFLSYDAGGAPEHVHVALTVTGPNVSAGNLLSRERLHPATSVAGDTIPAIQTTLQAIEAQSGQPAITYRSATVEMESGPRGTGQFESDGLLGGSFKDLLTFEGDYTFHAVATYGEDCVSSRELIWSIHVRAAVDPDKTVVTVNETAPGNGTIVIDPRDPFGNQIGPGRGNDLDVNGGPGTTVTGPVIDNGDGTYTVPVSWDPDQGGPGVVVGQPGRPPVVVGQPAAAAHDCWFWKLLCLILLLVLLLLMMVFWWWWVL